MVKIAEAVQQASENGRHYFAFEYVAPTTEAGVTTFYDRIERMSGMDPLFCSITWGDYGATAETSIEIASTCQSLLSLNYQVNITGYTSTADDLHQWLSVLKSKGVRNILVTRGRPIGAAQDGKVHFPHAVSVVKFVRQHFGDYFGIAVVAFPEKEEESQKTVAEMAFLKEKVDAGVDYIITQCVFDAGAYADFCTRCRNYGIRCPILPSINPLTQVRQLKAFGLARLAGAPELMQRIESARGDEHEVKRVAVAFHRELIRKLFSVGATGIYFITMNTEGVIAAIVRGMDLPTHRAFPWKPSENEFRRGKETVRPIHWSSRVTSYMARTATWTDFAPGEKWLSAAAAAAGAAPPVAVDAGGYHARLLLRSRAKRCTQFLTLGAAADLPSGLAEICRIFLRFLAGSGTLPWADELSGETEYVNEMMLKPLNARGLYTINSQPQINGVSSANKVVGWGPDKGYIYQKGYLEFFCPPALCQTVFTTLERYASLQYMAMDAKGKVVQARWPMETATQPAIARTTTTGSAAAAGCDGGGSVSGSGLAGDGETSTGSLFGSGVTTVTWGVFPGREIVQPTIVSVDSFRAWVGEAFGLWAAPFPGAEVPAVIQLIQSEWTLLSIVDNMFQESPSPLERAVLEVCSKIPPLTPIDAVTQGEGGVVAPVVVATSTTTNGATVTGGGGVGLRTIDTSLGLAPSLWSGTTQGIDAGARESMKQRDKDYDKVDLDDFLSQQKRLLLKSERKMNS